MALNKPLLIEAIRKALDDAKAKESGPEDAIIALATGIADGIDVYIKTGTVTGTTASACTAGGNVGTCLGTIS